MDALIEGAIARPAMAAVLVLLVVVVLFAILREVAKVALVLVACAVLIAGYWVYTGREPPGAAQRAGAALGVGIEEGRAVGGDLEAAARRTGRAKAEKALRKDQYGDGVAPHPISPAAQ